jgi:hypothetical protein
LLIRQFEERMSFLNFTQRYPTLVTPGLGLNEWQKRNLIRYVDWNFILDDDLFGLIQVKEQNNDYYYITIRHFGMNMLFNRPTKIITETAIYRLKIKDPLEWWTTFQRHKDPWLFLDQEHDKLVSVNEMKSRYKCDIL